MLVTSFRYILMETVHVHCFVHVVCLNQMCTSTCTCTCVPGIDTRLVGGCWGRGRLGGGGGGGGVFP